MDDYFLSLAEELLSKYGRIRTFTPHALSNGRYHEEALKQILKVFLPARFSVKTGFVHIPKEKVTSKECDLIIIDENEPNSYLFQDGEFVVVHPEAVVCVIEVKTRIDKKEFMRIHKASKALSDVRKKKRGLHRGCLYLAFAYDTVAIKNDEQLARWYKDIPVINQEEYDRVDYPANIVSLRGDLGVVQFLPNGKKWGSFKIYKEIDESPAWRLALFLMTIRTMTELRDGKEERSNEDWGINFKDAKRSYNFFRAGDTLMNISDMPKK